MLTDKSRAISASSHVSSITLKPLQFLYEFFTSASARANWCLHREPNIVIFIELEAVSEVRAEKY
jgi:hypothetical protein